MRLGRYGKPSLSNRTKFTKVHLPEPATRRAGGRLSPFSSVHAPSMSKGTTTRAHHTAGPHLNVTPPECDHRLKHHFTPLRLTLNSVGKSTPSHGRFNYLRAQPSHSTYKNLPSMLTLPRGGLYLRWVPLDSMYLRRKHGSSFLDVQPLYRPWCGTGIWTFIRFKFHHSRTNTTRVY